MEYTLDSSHPKFIRINVVGGLEKDHLISAMRELITHPDYTCKHSLWDMSQAGLGEMSMVDVKEIIGFLRLYKPEQKEFANKGAFLVKGLMNKALINIYVTLSKVLPFNYQVHTDQDRAIRFLTEE